MIHSRRSTAQRRSLRGVVSGASAAVSATPITIFGVNLVAWWEPRVSITDSGSGTATAIPDLSGNAKDLLQAGATSIQPTIVAGLLNGQKGIRCDGTDDYMDASLNLPAPATTQYTIFMLINQVSWTSGDQFCSGVVANAHILFQSGVSPAISMNNAAGVNNNNALAIGTPKLLSGHFTSSVADYICVGHPRTGTKVTGAQAGNNAQNGFRLARASSVSAAYANIEFFFGCIVTGAIDNASLDALADYLSPVFGSGPVT